MCDAVLSYFIERILVRTDQKTGHLEQVSWRMCIAEYGAKLGINSPD